MANDDPIFLAVKWCLLIINVISAVYIAWIFFDYMFSSKHGQGLNIPLMFNLIVGFLIMFMGAYAAWKEQYNLLIIYGIVLIVNLVIASFGGAYIYKANLGMYVICIILAFVFAYILHRGGSLTGSPA